MISWVISIVIDSLEAILQNLLTQQNQNRKQKIDIFEYW